MLILARSSTVRMEGLEPPHLTASDPKSDVSTNFTTSGEYSCESRVVSREPLFSKLEANSSKPNFWAANVADFTQKKRLFLSKFAVHGYPCAVTQI